MPCPICNTDNLDDASICTTCGAALSRGHGNADEVLAVGSTLQQGAYRINRVLGQGGFGITYLGTDAHLGRAVAIKEFFPTDSYRKGVSVQPSGTITVAQFHEAKQRFLEEARTLARFRHPGIVDVFAAFEENNTAYMVMEYVLGKTLGDVVRERGRVPEAEAIGYIRAAGDALNVVHEAGLLHRDIKPENLMLCRDGRVVLIDFGNARDFSIGRTQGHTVVVTPGYAPLEQYAQRAQRGAFSDVYGLAATLFFLLTGESPIPATDRAAGVEFEEPRLLVPEVSPHVSQAVRWAMELKVDHRPQSVREFLAALDGNNASSAANIVAVEKPPTDADRVIVRSTIESVYVQSANGADVPVVLNWPQLCACCGVTPAVTLPVVCLMAGELAAASQVWQVPYCSWCAQHIEENQKKTYDMPQGCIASLVSGAILFVLMFSWNVDSPRIGLLCVMGAAVIGILASLKSIRTLPAKPTCWSSGPAVTCTNVWYGDKGQIVYTLNFESPAYHQAFEEANNALMPLPEYPDPK